MSDLATARSAYKNFGGEQLADDYIVALAAEVEWLRVLVRSAYAEGYRKASHALGSTGMDAEIAWTQSHARAALRGEGDA